MASSQTFLARIIQALGVLLLAFPLLLGAQPLSAIPATSQSLLPQAVSLFQLPLSFEANRGQFQSHYDYLLRRGRQEIWFHRRGLVFRLSATGEVQTEVAMRFLQPLPHATLTGEQETATKTNYLSSSSTSSLTNVQHFAALRYREVWPGIALVLHASAASTPELEYDFLVRPGADPRHIRFQFSKHARLRLDANGDLLVQTAGGTMRHRAPQIYQMIRGVRKAIAGRFVLQRQTVSFLVGAYDPNYELVIDPIIDFTVFLGWDGSEAATAVALDAQGNIYLTGGTSSFYFPTTPGAFQTSETPSKGCSGPKPPFYKSCTSAFISKLSPDGKKLLFSTYLTGDAVNSATGIAVDRFGQVYVTGTTFARDFPVTGNAWQQNLRGTQDAFFTVLNATGTGLIYSTYLGGSEKEESHALALDAQNRVYLTGTTFSDNFPITTGALQTKYRGKFVPGYSIDIGGDAFVARFSPTFAVEYSTYLGGQGPEVSYDIRADAQGRAIIAGLTYSPDLPCTPGAFQTTLKGWGDAFVARLNASGSALEALTYLGGSEGEGASKVGVITTGEIWVAGATSSTNFPTTENAIQRFLNLDHKQAASDAFVTKLSANAGALLASTYFGGPNADGISGLQVMADDSVFLTGVPSFTTTEQLGIATTTKGSVYVAQMHPSGNAFLSFFFFGDSSTGRTFAPWAMTATPNEIYVGGAVSDYNGEVFLTKFLRERNNGVDLQPRLHLPTRLVTGQQGAYFIEVLNTGAQASNGAITLRTDLPPALQFVRAEGIGWNCTANGQQVMCTSAQTFGTLALSEIKLTVRATAANGTSLTTNVTLSAASDTDASNNTATHTSIIRPNCPVKITPDNLTLAGSYINRGIGVQIPETCLWSARSEADWLKIDYYIPSFGPTTNYSIGPGGLVFKIEKYRDPVARTARITVENEVFTLHQLAQTVSVSAAHYQEGDIGAGSIVSLFGANLASTTANATMLPLPTNLGGTSVKLILPNNAEVLCPLFYVSPTQINYYVPEEVYGREVSVVVTNSQGQQSGGTLDSIAPSPGLFTAAANGSGVAAGYIVRVQRDGRQQEEPIARYDAATQKHVSLPIEFGSPEEEVYLTLFGTGMRYVEKEIKVTIGGIDCPVTYAGPQGYFVGVDQINVRLPRTLAGKGEVDLALKAFYYQSNTVKLAFK